MGLLLVLIISCLCLPIKNGLVEGSGRLVDSLYVCTFFCRSYILHSVETVALIVSRYCSFRIR